MRKIKLVPCEFITHKQPQLQAGAGRAARAQLGWRLEQGRGVWDRSKVMHGCLYENTLIWKPLLGIQLGSPFMAYQGRFNKHVFYGASSTLLVMEIPGCILLPRHFTMLFYCCV